MNETFVNFAILGFIFAFGIVMLFAYFAQIVTCALWHKNLEPLEVYIRNNPCNGKQCQCGDEEKPQRP